VLFRDALDQETQDLGQEMVLFKDAQDQEMLDPGPEMVSSKDVQDQETLDLGLKMPLFKDAQDQETQDLGLEMVLFKDALNHKMLDLGPEMPLFKDALDHKMLDPGPEMMPSKEGQDQDQLDPSEDKRSLDVDLPLTEIQDQEDLSVSDPDQEAQLELDQDQEDLLLVDQDPEVLTVTGLTKLSQEDLDQEMLNLKDQDLLTLIPEAHQLVLLGTKTMKRLFKSETMSPGGRLRLLIKLALKRTGLLLLTRAKTTGTLEIKKLGGLKPPILRLLLTCLKLPSETIRLGGTTPRRPKRREVTL